MEQEMRVTISCIIFRFDKLWGDQQDHLEDLISQNVFSFVTLD